MDWVPPPIDGLGTPPDSLDWVLPYLLDWVPPLFIRLGLGTTTSPYLLWWLVGMVGMPKTFLHLKLGTPPLQLDIPCVRMMNFYLKITTQLISLSSIFSGYMFIIIFSG